MERTMWKADWRDEVWAQLDREWDLVVIGGGITGAGILREAARAGIRTLLVEGDDFAAGTSSRSSKMVHGGFRYLRNAQIKLTFQAVHERERLLREGRGLITPLSFLLVNYAGDHIPGWAFGAGLILYDLLAAKWGHRHYRPKALLNLCPQLNTDGLQGGYRYIDAKTDDARLVLRVILEAVADGGTALNYAHVEGLLRLHSGKVCGVALRDRHPDGGSRTAEVRAAVVINATGAWADLLASQVTTPPRLRRLRGSHLIFPAGKLPVTRSVSVLHPRDHRPVFAFPWENVTVAGTTDVDHHAPMDEEPAIDATELAYILEYLHAAFPSLDLGESNVISTYSGVRSVIDTGALDPSRESREAILSLDAGLLSVAGGKLTTFRLMAHDALRAVRASLPGAPRFDARRPVLDPLQGEWSFPEHMELPMRMRLLGRYGRHTPQLLAQAQPEDLQPIGETPYLWAELRWAAHAEGVCCLGDLLLRRVRLGLLLPQGGLSLMPRIRQVAQPALGWNDARWEREAQAYQRQWRACYSLPG
jgi:glycerol-3-phosphate dehydrogenase